MGASPAPTSVLLVEDDDRYARILSSTLAFASGGPWRVEIVHTAAAAMQRLAAGGIDALLLDMRLPDASGTEGVRRICGAFASLPVLVLTATEDDALGIAAVQAGAQDYLVKGQVEDRVLPRAIRYAIERKRSADSLRQLDKALHTMQIGVSITDNAGRIVYVNAAEAELHGYDPEELLGRDARSLSPREDWHPLSSEDLGRVRRWKRERIRYRKDGSSFPVQLMSDVVFDGGGHPLGIVTTCEDITERRQAQEALRSSEERYALAARGTNDGLWDWDLKTGRAYFSPRWKAMVGAEEDEIGDSPDEWLSRIHPDDAVRVRKKLDAHLAGLTARFEDEHRLRHRDGSYRWFLCRGDAVRGPDGKPYRMAGAQTDTSDRRSYDGLTGLANRPLLIDRLGESLDRARRRPGSFFALIFIDLDHFKSVNDTLGHQAGDRLLIEVARRLEVCVRPGDTVARLGGDEFAVLIERVEDAEDATRVADRIQQEMAVPLPLGGESVTPGASMGIALSVSGYQDPADMLRDADAAMYRAKSLGGGRWEVFDEAMRERVAARLRLQDDLRRATSGGEFRVHYHPIVTLDSGALRGFEALLRWRGLLIPVDVLSMAEEAGTVVRIGGWLLREACLQMGEWRRRFPSVAGLRLSLNVSSTQFQHLDLGREIEAVLAESGLPASQLAVEITEETLLRDNETVEAAFHRLEELGVAVELDRFGSGVTSVRALRRFALQGVKLDSGLVVSYDPQAESGRLVGGVVQLATALRLPVTAVGVESREQVDALRALGCVAAQGAYFAGPLEAGAVEKMLETGPTWAGPAAASGTAATA